MINIILDGKEMKAKESVHGYIKHQLANKEYYGSNLDALWDVLTSSSENIKINLINKEYLIENLGDYGSSIIEVFLDAAKENENIFFEITDLNLKNNLNMSYYIIENTDYTKSTWSGGETTQIIIYPPGSSYSNKDFNFRISSATVELDESDFTKLPCVQRFITPLNNSLRLTHDKISFIELKPFDIYEFSGDIPTKSYGKAIDFNLMLANNAKGKLKSLNVIRKLELNLFEDEIFKSGNENFEIIISPFENLEISIDNKKIELERMNTLIIRTNNFGESINMSIKTKENANILISQISIK